MPSRLANSEVHAFAQALNSFLQASFIGDPPIIKLRCSALLLRPPITLSRMARIFKCYEWSIDFHTRLDLADAVRLCSLIEPYNPFFVEDHRPDGSFTNW
jgi:hypothetical protein